MYINLLAKQIFSIAEPEKNVPSGARFITGGSADNETTSSSHPRARLFTKHSFEYEFRQNCKAKNSFVGGEDYKHLFVAHRLNKIK
jgi:hypothetical protein